MNLVELIFQRHHSDSLAVVDGDRSLTFSELNALVETQAKRLRDVLPPATDQTPRVGLACPNGIDHIILALAILRAGACLVPIADELVASEREELIERTSLVGIVSDALGTWQPCRHEEFPHESPFHALNPAFIRFSSGTTGKSKGVVLSHERLLERITLANQGLQINGDDRILWLLPMAHHFAVSIVLYLYFGACTVINRSPLGSEILQLAKRSQATVTYGSPLHLSLLAADSSDFTWTSLRLAVSTASALTRETAEAFYQRFQQPLVQGLGIIEIGLPILNFRHALEFPEAIGTPLPGVMIRLHGATASDQGELHICCKGMFDGYFSPWQPSAAVCDQGWFATGDLVQQDAQGILFLRGRKKSVLNIAGMKVFPEEIEAVLLKHPSVKLARVRGEDHRLLGTVPVAELIAWDQPSESSSIKAHCRRHLSDFKIPVRWTWVKELPLTASGKIRRV